MLAGKISRIRDEGGRVQGKCARKTEQDKEARQRGRGFTSNAQEGNFDLYRDTDSTQTLDLALPGVRPHTHFTAANGVEGRRVMPSTGSQNWLKSPLKTSSAKGRPGTFLQSSQDTGFK